MLQGAGPLDVGQHAVEDLEDPIGVLDHPQVVGHHDPGLAPRLDLALEELDEQFMLRKMPGVFVAGEMLDWEAPTGGYLLQASFATGAAAARGVLEFLKRRRAETMR